MKKICEPVQNLIKAQSECLFLYAPLIENNYERLNLEARYWAAQPRNDNDIRIATVSSFLYFYHDDRRSSFCNEDQRSIEQSHYLARVPETWIFANELICVEQDIYLQLFLDKLPKSLIGFILEVFRAIAWALKNFIKAKIYSLFFGKQNKRAFE